MKKKKTVTEVLNTTMIDIYEENITKKDLLKKLQEALDNFTECETLHSITLRSIVRVEENQVPLEKVASVLSGLVQDADTACL